MLLSKTFATTGIIEMGLQLFKSERSPCLNKGMITIDAVPITLIR